jgi:3-oxoacyl-[acyl-carrier protein] reductase
MAELGIKDRVALVTGGGRGIGRACCERLAVEGVHVAVNYHRDERAARAVADHLIASGCRSMIVRADVASPDDARGMIEQVEAELGPIELLVNNAGIFQSLSHEQTTLDVWQRTLDVNLSGTYHVTWAIKPGMIRRGYGRIVNIASIAGLRARPQCIAYAVSKAGVIALTKSLAEALAPHNIRVNAVAPGLIATEILDGVDPSVLDSLIRSSPIPRFGRPEEIAEMVLFLLSDQSNFTTGQTLVASGGRVMLP